MKVLTPLIGLSLACSCLLAVSCGTKGKDKSVSSNPESRMEVAVGFPLPVIPDTILLPELRKEFLLEHYWDNFPFADTATVANREAISEGCLTFLDLLADGETSPLLRKASWDTLSASIVGEEKAYEAFSDFIRESLFDSNSTRYNEELYAEFLQSLSRHIAPDDARQSTFRFRIDLIRRNAPGTPATDFSYYTPTGRKSTLSRTRVHGNRLLLLFYDPECGHCEEIIGKIKRDDRLAEMIQADKATVLAVYTEGNDSVWRTSIAGMPSSWTVATDREQIKEQALYDLKAMPTLYLLDDNRRVLLKDAPYEQIREQLAE